MSGRVRLYFFLSLLFVYFLFVSFLASFLPDPVDLHNLSDRDHSPSFLSSADLPYVDLSYKGEFGFELTTLLPYAYHLWSTGALRSTLGCGIMSSYYYFSPNHTDRFECHRSYGDSKVVQSDHGFPMWWGAWADSEWSRWRPPPLRAEYQNRPLPPGWPTSLDWRALALRPLVVIHNKHTTEWSHAPINTIDLPCLARLLELLSPRFTVLYSRVVLNKTSGGDDQPAWPFEDHAFVREWALNNTAPGSVLVLQDLPGEMNLAQISANSRSTRFISIQGGPMVLPTYFGGAHIVLHREGRELRANAYESSFPRLGGAMITTVLTCDEMCERASGIFVEPFVAMMQHRDSYLNDRVLEKDGTAPTKS